MYFAGICKKENKILSSLVYQKYLETCRLDQIIRIEDQDPELIQSYMRHRTRESRVRYFVYLESLNNQQNQLNFLRENGFLKFTMNYHFKYTYNKKDIDQKDSNILCKPLNKAIIEKLVKCSQLATNLEFRDYFYHHKNFFKERIDNIYYFHFRAKLLDHASSEIPIAFTTLDIDNEKLQKAQFTLAESHSQHLEAIINAFIESYVSLEQCKNFEFVFDDNQKTKLAYLRQRFEETDTKAVLLKPSMPKSKIQGLKQWANKIVMGVPKGQVINKVKD